MNRTKDLVYTQCTRYIVRPDHHERYAFMTEAPSDAVVIEIGQGFVTWVSPEDTGRARAMLWHCKPSGLSIYAVATDRSLHKDGRKLRLHHFIAGRVDGLVVDHINGNTLDNRRPNLRHVTHSVNATNRHTAQDLRETCARV